MTKIETRLLQLVMYKLSATNTFAMNLHKRALQQCNFIITIYYYRIVITNYEITKLFHTIYLF